MRAGALDIGASVKDEPVSYAQRGRFGPACLKMMASTLS